MKLEVGQIWFARKKQIKPKTRWWTRSYPVVENVRPFLRIQIQYLSQKLVGYMEQDAHRFGGGEFVEYNKIEDMEFFELDNRELPNGGE